MSINNRYGRRTVSGHVLTRLDGYLQKRGVPTSVYKASMDNAELRIANEARYPIEVQEDILRRAALFLKDELVGLKSGTYFRASKFGLYHTLLGVTASFEQDIFMSIRYMALETQAVRGRLIKGEHESQMIFAQTSDATGRHQLECIVMQALSRLYNTSPEWLRVTFSYDDRGLKEEYEKILRCPVEFNAPYNSVCAPTKHLSINTGRQDDEMREHLEPVAKKRLQDLFAETSVVDEVQFQVYQGLTIGEPMELSDIAENMGMSERSLQKYLKTEETSYREIANQVRIERAIELLREPNIPTSEIAQHIGFEELSSFYRFLKKMTGMNVKELRDKLAI